MTLAKAKQVLKSYARKGWHAPAEVEEAIAKIVDSWNSKATTGKGRRAKGHGYERTVANYLKPIYPDAKRGLQSRGGGVEVPDVDGTPLYVECKRKKTVSGILAAFYRAQAESDGRPAVVVAKEDDRPEVAIVPLELLLGLLVDLDGDLQRWIDDGRKLMKNGGGEDV